MLQRTLGPARAPGVAQPAQGKKQKKPDRIASHRAGFILLGRPRLGGGWERTVRSDGGEEQTRETGLLPIRHAVGRLHLRM